MNETIFFSLFIYYLKPSNLDKKSNGWLKFQFNVKCIRYVNVSKKLLMKIKSHIGIINQPLVIINQDNYNELIEYRKKVYKSTPWLIYK